MICKCDNSALFPRCDRYGKERCTKLEEKRSSTTGFLDNLEEYWVIDEPAE